MAADQGHAGAQNNLGCNYYYGQGVEQSYEEAAKWYRLAADQEYAPAQCNLGYAYGEGQGVMQSYKEAVRWYRLAADQGYAPAQCNLGFMYERGLGVEQSDEKAILWWKKAANQGDSDAIDNLELMLEKDYDIKQYNDETVNEISYSSNKNLDTDIIIKNKTAHNVLEKQHETLVEIGYDTMFDDEPNDEYREGYEFIQQSTTKSNVNIDDEWILLISKLSETEKSYLKMIMSTNNHPSNKWNEISRYDIENSINETSSDIIGDAIIDNGTIIEDYRYDLERVLSTIG